MEESLSLSGSVSNITVTWDAVNDRLSLQGNASVRASDVEAALAALQLQTVRFKDDSYRTISISPNVAEDVLKKDFYVREVKVDASPPNPLVEVDFDKVRLDPGWRLVLGEEHILVYDPDTTDASQVFFRVSGLEGGKLQRRPSGSGSSWQDISSLGLHAYLEFTLAELQAGRIAILVGNGIAKADGGEGEKITFQLQAADAPDSNANLSDSDPDDGESDADPLDVEIQFIPRVQRIAGETSLINADEVLSPNAVTLDTWKQEAEGAPHRGTLGVVVGLLDKRAGDTLSLRTGYDTNKITPRWDDSTGELFLEIGRGATAAEIRAALKLLELDTEIAGFVSTRRVWVFPVLSGVDNFRYRVDEAVGLVRYYLRDSTDRSFSAASTAASRPILFGKQGYLGVPLSDGGKSIYAVLRADDIHLAITDVQTEGKWLITEGPRKGLLFWDHTASKYGPGAEGSGWTLQGHFWYWTDPDGGRWENYATMGSSERISDVIHSNYRDSISHHDLLLSDGFVRLVEVRKSPPHPILTVDFSKFQATARRPLILTENQISVEDPDTRDSLDPTKLDAKVDASKIKFRITNIQNGTLQSRLASDPDTWTKIVADGSNAYLEFTLAQLQSGLVAFFPDAATSPLAFDIQAADDGLPSNPGSAPHLSDSDRSTSDPDPESVSVSVVALKTVAVGEEVRINDDGVLTPERQYAGRMACCRRHAADIRGSAGRQERDCHAQRRSCARAPFRRLFARYSEQQDCGFVGCPQLEAFLGGHQHCDTSGFPNDTERFAATDGAFRTGEPSDDFGPTGYVGAGCARGVLPAGGGSFRVCAEPYHGA